MSVCVHANLFYYVYFLLICYLLIFKIGFYSLKVLVFDSHTRIILDNIARNPSSNPDPGKNFSFWLLISQDVRNYVELIFRNSWYIYYEADA